MIEKILHKKRLFALIVRRQFRKKSGINFFTSKKATQQFGFMKHKKNHFIKPHKHNKRLTRILRSTEVILLLKGTLRADFYNNNNKYLLSKIINEGDIIMLIHGGPWARDSWGFNPLHQWLANRGYAVVSPNFRGSTGFGKNHVNAGDREWYGKMQDDINDAAAWAVEQGFADEDRMCIMGGSYGGYATLAGMTRDPELWACGVDIVGPSHVGTLLKTIPPYWAPIITMFTTRVGSLDEPEFLDSISPLTHVQKINKPLLIGQGANDPRVKLSESDQIVEAMNSADLPVTYVVFPDEGHGFRNPKNNMAFMATTEAFLAKHLGGRAEPIGNSINESTAQIRDKGGLDFGDVTTYVAEEGEDEVPSLLTMEVSVEDLSPDQQAQFNQFLEQLDQLPTEMLQMVLDQIISQAGQAPPDELALGALIAQTLDKKIKGE